MANLLFVNSTAVHGGAEEALLMLMRACVELGHTPFLLVPCRGWLTDRAAALGIEAHTLPALPDVIHVRRAWQQFLPLPLTVAGICGLIRRLRIDAVHSNSPRTAYHAGIAAWIMGVRAITHVHDIVNVPYLHARRAKLLYRVSDLTIVPSEAVAHTLGSAPGGGPHPIRILYNGRLTEEYETAPADLRAEIAAPADAFVIGNVSVMNVFKGQDHAIRAFAELHRRHANCRLVIVGDGQGAREQAAWKAHLHELVRTLNVENVVHFLGWREDVYALMRAFDLFVHSPVQPDPLPMVCIHALAVGCPSVGYDTGGVGEIILGGECGELAPVGDVEALAAAMERVYSNPRLRRTYAANSLLHFSARFSYAGFVKNVRSIFEPIRE